MKFSQVQLRFSSGSIDFTIYNKVETGDALTVPLMMFFVVFCSMPNLRSGCLGAQMGLGLRFAKNRLSDTGDRCG